MIPKSWAVLTDALDEGCAHGARRAIEITADCGRIGLTDEAGAEARQRRVAEAIRAEILNAICERFDFVDPEGA